MLGASGGNSLKGITLLLPSLPQMMDPFGPFMASVPQLPFSNYLLGRTGIELWLEYTPVR